MVMDKGIDARIITVSRQFPRKRKIMRAVNPAAIRPPILTLFRAARTNTDWSKSGLIETALGIIFKFQAAPRGCH